MTTTADRTVLAKSILCQYACGCLTPRQAKSRLAALDYEADFRAWNSAALKAWDRCTDSAIELTC
jgi:hypothetical protein